MKVSGKKGDGWKGVADSYTESLLRQLDQLRKYHFNGDLRPPLSVAELELVSEVLADGQAGVRARADDCLDLVQRRSHELDEEPRETREQPAALAAMAPAPKKKKKLSGKSPDEKPVWAEVRKIELKSCVPHPANREHSAENVADRVASLRATGQLEPVKVLVRPAGGKIEYLTLGGWGRILAARQLRWTEIEARVLVGMQAAGGAVREPTERDLLGLLAEDNSQRADLSVLEKARLGQLLQAAGCTQNEAARRVGFRAGSSLSNAERLLQLPEDLQQRVLVDKQDESWISQAVARRIADYAHVPEVLEAVRKDLAHNREEWLSFPEESLLFVLRSELRPVTREAAAALDSNRTAPPGVESLPVVRVPFVDRDGERIEIDVTPARKEWDEAWKAASKGGGCEDEPAQEKPRKQDLTPEEKRTKAREKAEQLEKRRARWEYRFRHQFVARKLPRTASEDAWERLTTWAIVESHQKVRDHLYGAIERAGHKKGLGRTYVSPEECLAYVPRQTGESSQLGGLRRSLLLLVLDDTATGNPDFPHVPRKLIDDLCEDLGFVAAREWEQLGMDLESEGLLRDLWNCHDTEQLTAIADEYQISAADPKKGALVEALVQSHANIPLPAWLAPQEAKTGKAKRGGK